mmetsp:Transcript_32904/g.57519  ORF Transcript_32904/g.57519 Transcript_32904/m.57519 type:complete len:634 (+) Transcript_32904:36-1937(+)
MESLQSLRSKLISLQQKPHAIRFNDRDVVELLRKLTGSGLQIFYSTSGKEYVTPVRLEREIRDEVIRHGRIQVLELPKLLGFNLDQVEKTAFALVDKDPQLFLVDGQLMAASYLDSLAEEADAMLRNAGMLPLSVLTIKFSLPSNFLKAQLELRQGTLLRAQFKENGSVLYTDLYIQQHLARLRGFLRGTTQPSQLKQFDKALVAIQIQDLFTRGQVSGQFEGGVYTPTSYLHARKQELLQFFNDQGYITHIQIRDLMGKADAEAILGEEARKFKNCYASRELVASTRAKVLEVLERQEIAAILDDYDWPGGEDDIDEVLEGLPGVYVVEGFAYGDSLVDKAMAVCKSLVPSVEESKRDTKRKKATTVALSEVERVLRKANLLKRHASSPALFSALCQQIQAKLSSITPTVLEPPREVKAATNLEHDFAVLQVLVPSVAFVKDQSSNFGALSVYLIKTQFTQFFNDLLTLQLKNQGLQVPQPVQANNRVKYVQQLPDYLKAIFNKLIEALTQKNCEGFLQTLVDNAREIPAVSFMLLNKKTKKNFITSLNEAASADLKTAVERSDLPSVFNLAVRTRLLENFQVFIPLPLDVWAQDLLATIYEKAFNQDDSTLKLWQNRETQEASELLQAYTS